MALPLACKIFRNRPTYPLSLLCNLYHQETPAKRILADKSWLTEYPQEDSFGDSKNPLSQSFQRQISDRLVRVFSKPNWQRPETELRELAASKITNVDIETVLQRLHKWNHALEFFRWLSSQQGFNFKHSCYTYNAMASILCRSRQNEALKDLIQEMLKEKCIMSAGALGFLIRCVGSAGMAKEALHLFENSQNFGCIPNVYTYNCLLEVLAKSKMVDLVDLKYNEMINGGHSPDKYTFAALLQAYSVTGRFAKASQVFELMSDQGFVDQYAFSILVVNLSKFGQADKAFELLEVMRRSDIILNEKTYYVLIHGFVQEGHVLKALAVLRQMEHLGIVVDFLTYQVVIEGLCRHGEVLQAGKLISEIREKGLITGVSFMAKLIQFLCREGHMDAVRQLLQDSRGVFGENLTRIHNLVLEELVKGGNSKEAYSFLLDRMEMQVRSEEIAECRNGVDGENANMVPTRCCNLDVVSFAVVINGLCTEGNLEMALNLLKAMDKVSIFPNVETYNNLICELCRGGRLSEGYKLLDDMAKRDIHPTQHTYNLILGCLCKEGNVTEAVDLMKEMRICGYAPWIKHCTLLVKKFCDKGKPQSGLDVLSQMVEAGLRPDLVSYTAVIGGLCMQGEVDRAYTLLRQICSRNYAPDVVVYNVLINGFCKAGRVEDSLDILNEMLEKNHRPTAATYNAIIDGLCKAGKVDVALLFLQKMDEEGRKPNIITYTTLIHGLFYLGKPKDALDMWDQLEQSGCCPNVVTYTVLIQGLCKCGNTKVAYKYFLEMERKGIEAEIITYSILVSGLVQDEEIDLAIEVLDKLVWGKNYQDLQDMDKKALANCLLTIGKSDKGSNFINRTMKDGWLANIHEIIDTESKMNKEGS